jgi:hypothetical protein
VQYDRKVMAPRMTRVASASTIWNEVTPANLASDELIGLFEERKEEERKRDPRPTEQGRPDGARVVTKPGRLVNINVLLKKTRLDVDKLGDYILLGGNDDVPAELFSLIAANLVPPAKDPLAYERERDALLSYDGSDGPLHRAEYFLKQLYMIPRVAAKLDTIVFLTDFPMLCRRMAEKPVEVEKGLSCLRDKNWRELLGVALGATNCLLEARGLAPLPGFKFSSLRQLVQLKSPSSRQSLLSYVVRQLRPPVLSWLVAECLPTLTRAYDALVDFLGFFPAVLPDLALCERELDACTSMAEARFQERMREQYEAASRSVEGLAATLADLDRGIQYLGDNEDLGLGSEQVVRQCAAAWERVGTTDRYKTWARRDAQRVTFFLNLTEFLKQIGSTAKQIRDQAVRAAKEATIKPIEEELKNRLERRRNPSNNKSNEVWGAQYIAALQDEDMAAGLRRRRRAPQQVA